MKKNVILFIIIFFFTMLNLYSSPYRMILSGDPVLDDLHFLSVESGKSFISFSPPLAQSEIINFLNNINISDLSDAAKLAYNRIIKKLTILPRLSWSDDYFAVFFNASAELEGKVRFNPDISWEPDNSKFTQLLSVPIQFFFVNRVQLYVEPTVGKRPGLKSGNDYFDMNIPADSHHFDIEYWPFRSFGAAGGSWWNFYIGRDRLFWGTGHTGSLSFSDNSTFLDFARLSFFSPVVKYSFFIIQLPLTLTDSLFPNPSQTDWSENGLEHTMQRYFYLHRLDVNLFKRLSIGLMEGVLVGNSPIEIRYLNPLIIFHSLYAWEDFGVWEPNEGSMVGSFLSAELNLNIIKSLNIYGQFTLNQFALRKELKSSSQPPNSLAYMAGINFTRSIKNWGSHFYLEFIYTDPYFMLLSSPFSSFIQMDYNEYNILGHSRDTMMLSFGSKFFNDNFLKLSAIFTWAAYGAHNKDGFLWDWRMNYDDGRTTRDEKTPTGITENKLILSLGAEWNPLKWLCLKANLSGIVSLNNDHIDGNNKAGGQASLSVKIYY